MIARVTDRPALGRHTTHGDRHELLLFAGLAFAISWSAWVVAGVVGGTIGAWARIAGSFGPSIAALVIHGRGGGRPAVRRALRMLVRARGAAGATVAAATIPVALAWAAVQLDRVAGSSMTIDWPPWWTVPLVVVWVLLLGGPLGEELGWRGFLLPRLESTLGPTVATWVVATVWAGWHAPLFLIDGTVQQLLPVWVFVAQIVVTSFFYTWLTHVAPDTLVPSLAFHTSFNAVVGIVLLQPPEAPATRPLLIALALATVVAAGLVRTAGFRGGRRSGLVPASSTIGSRDARA